MENLFLKGYRVKVNKRNGKNKQDMIEGITDSAAVATSSYI